MKLIIVGASGLVGGEVLALALADPAVDAVMAPARRAMAATHPKLHAPLVDFDALPSDAAWWKADAVVCTLGTTRRKAGSEQAFRRVDHDYPLAAAKLAHAHGTPTYVLNSAMGADANSRFFYNRVKGEVERDLAEVGFRSLTFVRPGLIGGERDEFRAGERIGLAAFAVLAPVLPRRLRINPAGHIARELLHAALQPEPGTHVVESDRMI